VVSGRWAVGEPWAGADGCGGGGLNREWGQMRTPQVARAFQPEHCAGGWWDGCFSITSTSTVRVVSGEW
jgi:hypothetical protein